MGHSHCFRRERKTTCFHAELLRELGEISRARGNPGAARSAWREAGDAFAAIGASHDAADVSARIELLPS